MSITPDPAKMAYTLGGYGDPGRFKNRATAIHDTCYARALVLESGSAKCALVSLDLCYLPANVKTAVAARTGSAGLPAASLFLSATHTHSGPEPLLLHSANTGPSGDLPKFDPALLAYVADHIAQAILEANRALVPARLGSGQRGPIGLNRNRRGEPGTDDQMTALKVLGADGRTIAALVNYAAHPVYYGAENLAVSGDWAGTFERVLEAGMPGAVVLFLNGAEGDASPHGSDAGTPAEKIDIYAAKLAQPARELLASIQPESNPQIAIWNQSVSLPARSPHVLFLLAAAALKATGEQARAFVNRLMPEKTEITFLRAGEALLIGFPGEPTTPVGLAAKAAAAKRGFKIAGVVALTNDWLGYLVTDTQYRAGKYEPTMSFYGPSIGAVILEGVAAGLSRSP